MFLTLLAVTFLIALSVSFIIVRLFGRSITNILERLIEESIVGAWLRYLKFAIYVVGVSSGVRIWQLEKYITPIEPDQTEIIVLNTDRWILEVYRTIIGSLHGIAWLLLVFFVFALTAYVIVRFVEFWEKKK